MNAPAEPAVRWRPTIRLMRATHINDAWKELLVLGFFFLLMALADYREFLAGIEGRSPTSSVSILLVMSTLALYTLVGAANAGWKYLPVTQRERKAAAWLVVSVAPLLFHFATWATAVMAFFLSGHRASPGLILSTFGVHGVAQQFAALLIFLFADWPTTISQTMDVGQRKPRDWMLLSMIIAFGIASTASGRLVIPLADFGPLAALAALVICLAQLPIALRIARLSPNAPKMAKRSDRLSLGVPGRLRLGGWPGHFVREAVRAAGFTVAALMGGMLVALQSILQPGGNAHGGRSPDLLTGILELPWMVPLMISLFVGAVSQSNLLRQRRMLLSLPDGARLLLVTPAFVILLVIVLSLAVAWLWAPAEQGWGGHVLVAVMLGLAFGYLQFAAMLGASRTGTVMLATMLVSIPVAVLVGISAAAPPIRLVLRSNEVGIAAGASLILTMSLIWCRHQLSHSRKPYRPWPVAPSRWRGV